MGAALDMPLQQTVLAMVLWVDDEPKAIELYRRILESERGDLRIGIDIASSLGEARKKLKSGRYSAVVMDCKMDIWDDSVNGAEFLAELNDKQKDLPTFVYSAYLDSPLYEGALSKSYVVRVMSKLDSFASPISEDIFFRAINEAALRYVSLKHLRPERIKFSDYLKKPSQYADETNQHWEKFGYWIQLEMQRRKLAWCVVCGDQIVRESQTPFDFPNDEKLHEIGLQMNLIPFAYSAELNPEDMSDEENHTKWQNTNIPGDYYPRLVLELAGKEIEGDFDTGAIRTHISDALVSQGLVNFWRRSETGHLGIPYRFYSKSIPVRIIDQQNNEVKGDLSVTVIENWHASSFILVNPMRLCLFGRDILQKFQVEIVLNSGQRHTKVRLLGSSIGKAAR